MTLVQIIVLAIIVMVMGGIALLTFFLIRGTRRLREMKARTLANATPATAQVLTIDQDGYSEAEGVRRLLMKLDLRVNHPYKGEYQAATRWFVKEFAIPQIQPGSEIAVKVNADDPSRVYPEDEWAEFADWEVRRPVDQP
jgi:hypothetical protein